MAGVQKKQQQVTFGDLGEKHALFQLQSMFPIKAAMRNEKTRVMQVIDSETLAARLDEWKKLDLLAGFVPGASVDIVELGDGVHMGVFVRGGPSAAYDDMMHEICDRPAQPMREISDPGVRSAIETFRQRQTMAHRNICNTVHTWMGRVGAPDVVGAIEQNPLTSYLVYNAVHTVSGVEGGGSGSENGAGAGVGVGVLADDGFVPEADILGPKTSRNVYTWRGPGLGVEMHARPSFSTSNKPFHARVGRKDRALPGKVGAHWGKGGVSEGFHPEMMHEYANTSANVSEGGTTTVCSAVAGASAIADAEMHGTEPAAALVAAAKMQDKDAAFVNVHIKSPVFADIGMRAHEIAAKTGLHYADFFARMGGGGGENAQKDMVGVRTKVLEAVVG